MECKPHEHKIVINEDGLAICEKCGSCRGAIIRRTNEKEFNLSEKITFVRKDEDWILLPLDVKEFINLLKEYVSSEPHIDNESTTYILDEIDKLAGEKFK